MEEITQYLDSWHEFRRKCEKKAKDRCYINSKGWRKLRDFHMEHWLKTHKFPFGFMFRLKYRHGNIYNSIHCAPKWYYRVKLQRRASFSDPISRKLVVFPSWIRYKEKL